MKHRAIFGVCFVGAMLVLACGGGQGHSSSVRVVGKEMPAGGNWDGVYQSPAYGRMEITAAGSGVTALYEGERHFGTIQGVIDGDVVNFTWTQWNEDLQGKLRSKTGRGYFRYSIEEEQGAKSSHQTHKIAGEWGYGEDNAGNKWDAVKLREGTKKILKPRSHEGAEPADDEYSGSSGFGAGGSEEAGSPSSSGSSESSSGAPAETESSSGGDSMDNLF